MVVGLELMRERAVARPSAGSPATCSPRRSPAASTPTSCAAGCGRSGSAARPRCSSSSSRTRTPASERARAAPTRASPPWSRPAPPRGGRSSARWSTARAGEPVEVAAARARSSRATHGQVRAAASRRHRGRLAASRLPRGPLRARGDLARQRRRARGGVAPRPRRLHAAALAPGRRRAAALHRGLLAPIEGTEGEYGGELLRSLEAFIEQNGHWERAARRALLPSAHAALPDPQGRGADRTRSQPRHGPDRAVARAAGEGAGGMNRS